MFWNVAGGQVIELLGHGEVRQLFLPKKKTRFGNPKRFVIFGCVPQNVLDEMNIANYYTAVTCPTTAETLAKTGCNWPLAILRVTRHELFQIRPCLQRRSRLREKLLLSDLKEISGHILSLLAGHCHPEWPASIIWMVSVFAFSTSRLVKVPDTGNQMCMWRLFRTLVFWYHWQDGRVKTQVWHNQQESRYRMKLASSVLGSHTCCETSSNRLCATI